MRDWTVAGGLIEGPEGLLLVRNRRRWGSEDWSPPGGVIDATDSGIEDGLTREVFEETGITVTGWEGPLYRVEAVAHDFGWHLKAHVYLALTYEGAITVADPDGIVIDAAFVPRDECAALLSACYQWVREPLGEWLEHRWGSDAHRAYHYDVFGSDPRSLRVERIAHE